MNGVFRFNPETEYYENGMVEVQVIPVKRKRKTGDDFGYVRVHGATRPHADSIGSVSGELVCRFDLGEIMNRCDGDTALRLDFQGMCKALDERCNGVRNDGATSPDLQVEPKTIEDIALSHFNYSRMDEQRQITPDELNRLALQARQSQRIQGNYTQAHKRRQSLNGRQTRFYKAGSMLG